MAKKKTSSKKRIDKENGVIKSLSNPWEFMGYALRYRTKEIFGGVILLLVSTIIILFMLLYGYDSKQGFFKKSSETKVEIQKK